MQNLNRENKTISYAKLLGPGQVYDTSNIFRKILIFIFWLITEEYFEYENTKNEKPKIIFQRNVHNRKDYVEIEENFTHQISPFFNIVEIKLKKKMSIYIFKNLALIIKAKRIIEQIDVKMSGKITAYTHLIRCLKLEKKYEELLNNDIHAVVTFCDVHLYDNYLTQLANNRNIPTYTFQHGVMHHDMKQYGDKSFLHFENSPSKNIFVWGEYFQKQYVENGFKPKENVIIAGNSKINSIVTDEVLLKQNKDKFIVILDREVDTNKQYNEQVVAIANKISQQTGMIFDIRIHPLTKTDYSMYIENKEKNQVNKSNMDYKNIVENYNFALVHMTSMYYELTCLGMKVFRLKSEYITNVDHLDFDKIENYEEYLCKDKIYAINKPQDFSNYYISKINNDENIYLEALKNAD